MFFTARMRQSRGTLPTTQSLRNPRAGRLVRRRLCGSLGTATELSGLHTHFNHAGGTLHSYAISELLDTHTHTSILLEMLGSRGNTADRDMAEKR